MKGFELLDSHRIARLCQGSGINRDDGQPLGVAFLPRRSEAYLSVNWVDHLKCPDGSAEVIELRTLYEHKLDVGRNAKIAFLSVGLTRTEVSAKTDDHRKLRILHWPESYRNKKGQKGDDPTHSGIWELRHNDELIGELIRSTMVECVPAKNPGTPKGTTVNK